VFPRASRLTIAVSVAGFVTGQRTTDALRCSAIRCCDSRPELAFRRGAPARDAAFVVEHARESVARAHLGSTAYGGDGDRRRAGDEGVVAELSVRAGTPAINLAVGGRTGEVAARRDRCDAGEARDRCGRCGVAGGRLTKLPFVVEPPTPGLARGAARARMVVARDDVDEPRGARYAYRIRREGSARGREERHLAIPGVSPAARATVVTHGAPEAGAHRDRHCAKAARARDGARDSGARPVAELTGTAIAPAAKATDGVDRAGAPAMEGDLAVAVTGVDLGEGRDDLVREGIAKSEATVRVVSGAEQALIAGDDARGRRAGRDRRSDDAGGGRDHANVFAR